MTQPEFQKAVVHLPYPSSPPEARGSANLVPGGGGSRSLQTPAQPCFVCCGWCLTSGLACGEAHVPWHASWAGKCHQSLHQSHVTFRSECTMRQSLICWSFCGSSPLLSPPLTPHTQQSTHHHISPARPINICPQSPLPRLTPEGLGSVSLCCGVTSLGRPAQEGATL